MTTTLSVTGWTGVSNGIWTEGSNKVIDKSGGIVNLALTTANTLDGKDSITGAGGIDTSNAVVTGLSPLYFGVENLGNIVMGNGHDFITGTATGNDPTYFVFGIYNEMTISIGNGNNDSISGTATGDGDYLGNPSSFGAFSIGGIYNRGTIEMGNGNNDSISGIGKATGVGSFSEGIFNRQGGIIAMGDGNNDSISGTGGYYNGIYNRGTIKMGNGNNDSITGIGSSDGAYGIYNQNYNGSNPTITLGNGNHDSLTGIAKGSSTVGIYNEMGCTITMGDGNDTIRGITTHAGNGSAGIYNDGTIILGNGNDTITADGGFAGSGFVYLGNGKDTVNGFGSGYFIGGSGKDTLVLPSGSYTVGSATLNNQTFVTLTSGGITQDLHGFTNLTVGCTSYSFNNLSSGTTVLG